MPALLKRLPNASERDAPPANNKRVKRSAALGSSDAASLPLISRRKVASARSTSELQSSHHARPAAADDSEKTDAAADLIYDLGVLLAPLPSDRRQFAAYKSLSGAPLPCLDIVGAGRVESASPRDAAAVKACAADVMRHMPIKHDVSTRLL